MGRPGEARNREWVGAEGEGRCWPGWGAAIFVMECTAGQAVDRDAVPGLCSESTEKSFSITQMYRGYSG